MTDWQPHKPWSQPGCTSPGCESTDIATVDGVRGKRCADHPPRFDAATAVEIAVSGLPGAAAAYVRWSE